jgi:hypothetical protein
MRAIAEQARVEHGVLLEPGDIFFNRPEEARRFFRLGFTAIATHRIEPGLRLLAGLMPARASRVSRGRKGYTGRAARRPRPPAAPPARAGSRRS